MSGEADEHFNDVETKRILRRFQKLDSDGRGLLKLDDFLSVPELSLNPLLERVFRVLDTNGDERLEFAEFLAGISKFAQKGDLEAKLKFVFQIYDIDGDGFISNPELFHVLKIMVGKNLTEAQLQQIVDKTILEADLDRDGKLSFQEFLKIVNENDELVSSGSWLTLPWAL